MLPWDPDDMDYFVRTKVGVLTKVKIYYATTSLSSQVAKCLKNDRGHFQGPWAITKVSALKLSTFCLASYKISVFYLYLSPSISSL